MKTLIALFLVAGLAPMAARAADTITVTVVSDVPGASGTLSNTMTFTQADMAKFIAFAQGTYVCAPVAPETTCAALTLPQVLAAYTAALEGETKAMVNNYLDNVGRSSAVHIAPN